MNATTTGGGGSSSSGGLGILLQRLRAAVGSAYAPDTPDTDDGGRLMDESGVTGGGDVEGVGLLGGGGGGVRSGGLLNSGGVGRWALRVLEAYGERRRRFLGRFKVGVWMRLFGWEGCVCGRYVGRLGPMARG